MVFSLTKVKIGWGYVFRNRYYTHEILDQKHLLNTFVSIHRNPIKANIVKKKMNINIHHILIMKKI